MTLFRSRSMANFVVLSVSRMRLACCADLHIIMFGAQRCWFLRHMQALLLQPAKLGATHVGGAYDSTRTVAPRAASFFAMFLKPHRYAAEVCTKGIMITPHYLQL